MVYSSLLSLTSDCMRRRPTTLIHIVRPSATVTGTGGDTSRVLSRSSRRPVRWNDAPESRMTWVHPTPAPHSLSTGSCLSASAALIWRRCVADCGGFDGQTAALCRHQRPLWHRMDIDGWPLMQSMPDYCVGLACTSEYFLFEVLCLPYRNV